MKNETILAIKEDINKLLCLFRQIRKPFHYNEHKFSMIEVLLSNMAFVSSDTKGYSPDKELENMETILNALNALKEYDNNDWMVGFICDEAKMAFDGNCMSEEYIHLIKEEIERTD